MGLTPLEGLVMGTRSGDVDPGVVFHLLRNAGMDADQVDNLLNRRSGMLGLSGVSDFRDLHRLIAAGGDDGTAASLALDVYCHRVRKYVGAYLAVLGGADVIAFTAGVGENDAVVRARILQGLEPLGSRSTPRRTRCDRGEPRVISPEGSPVTVMVVPTNEELAIAQATCSWSSADPRRDRAGGAGRWRQAHPVLAVLEGLTTIGVVVAVGYLLARTKLLPDSTPEVLSRLVFFVATPALLLKTLAGALDQRRCCPAAWRSPR